MEDASSFTDGPWTEGDGCQKEVPEVRCGDARCVPRLLDAAGTVGRVMVGNIVDENLGRLDRKKLVVVLDIIVEIVTVEYPWLSNDDTMGREGLEVSLRQIELLSGIIVKF